MEKLKQLLKTVDLFLFPEVDERHSVVRYKVAEELTKRKKTLSFQSQGHKPHFQEYGFTAVFMLFLVD